MRVSGSGKKTISFERRKIRAAYLFILPLIIGIAFFFVSNMVKSFWFSLNEINILGDGNGYSLTFKGTVSYNKALFEDSHFVRYAVESLGKIIVRVPTILIFSLFIASILNQKFRGRIVARTVFFVPVILATGIVGLLNSWDLSYYMGSDAMSDAIGGSQFALSEFLASLDLNETLMEVVTSAASGISSIVNASGLQIFIFLAAFQEVPEALFEAAYVEGCTGWEVFWKITFPMVSPQLAVNAVYTVVDSFTQSNDTLFTYIEELAFSQNQYSTAMAMYIIYLTGLGLIMAVVATALARMIKNGR